MKILDTAMTEIVKGNSARYYSKYVVDEKEHTKTLNNFKFQNMINSNNEITIGNTCSSGVTFSIYMPAITVSRQDMTAEYQTCGQMETWLLKDMGETAGKPIDVAVTLRARDYKGLDNYGSNGVIEWKN